jgi:hypothetical protein
MWPEGQSVPAPVVVKHADTGGRCRRGEDHIRQWHPVMTLATLDKITHRTHCRGKLGTRNRDVAQRRQISLPGGKLLDPTSAVEQLKPANRAEGDLICAQCLLPQRPHLWEAGSIPDRLVGYEQLTIP